MPRRLRNRSGAASFLCYHSIAPEGSQFLSISPDLFERQLHLFKRLRLRSGVTDDLHRIAAGGERSRTVFITFDDGFADNYELAMPLLREYGFRATVFVLPPLLATGAPLAWPEVASARELYPQRMRSLTWDMAGEMAEAGIEIGSHTLTHPHLPQLGREELNRQLEESRQTIIDRLGSCETIAYPFGDWSPAVAEAAARAGYSFGYTLPTARGQAKATAHSIPRINVDRRDNALRMQSKIGPIGKRAFLSAASGAIRETTRPLRHALSRHAL